MTKCCWNVAG